MLAAWISIIVSSCLGADTLGIGPVSLGRHLDYEIVRELGYGSFKQTYLAQALPGTMGPRYVVLSTCKAADIRHCLSEENIPFLEKLKDSNPNFLRYELGFTEASFEVYGTRETLPVLVSEFTPNVLTQSASEFKIDRPSSLPIRELESRVKGLRMIAEQTSQAIYEMEDLGFVHNDLHTENLFVRYPYYNGLVGVSPLDFIDGLAHVALGDYDLVQSVGTSLRSEGKLPILSPERRNSRAIRADRAQDIFSMGSTLLEVGITGPKVHAPTAEQAKELFDEVILGSSSASDETRRDLHWLKDQTVVALDHEPTRRRLLVPKQSDSGVEPVGTHSLKTILGKLCKLPD